MEPISATIRDFGGIDTKGHDCGGQDMEAEFSLLKSLESVFTKAKQLFSLTTEGFMWSGLVVGGPESPSTLVFYSQVPPTIHTITIQTKLYFRIIPNYWNNIFFF